MFNTKSTTAQVLETIRTAHAYPVMFFCRDGGVLCQTCAQDNLGLIGQAITDGSDPQWEVHAVEVHWEGDAVPCDNCYEGIESAYGEV